VGKILDSPNSRIVVREKLADGSALRFGSHGGSTCVDLEDEVFNWQLCASSPLGDHERDLAIAIARTYTRTVRGPLIKCKYPFTEVGRPK
jgi:hypothetical protein